MIINPSQNIRLEINLTDDERNSFRTMCSLLADLESAIRGRGCDTISLGGGEEATIDQIEEARDLISVLWEGLGDNEIW